MNLLVVVDLGGYVKTNACRNFLGMTSSCPMILLNIVANSFELFQLWQVSKILFYSYLNHSYSIFVWNMPRYLHLYHHSKLQYSVQWNAVFWMRTRTFLSISWDVCLHNSVVTFKRWLLTLNEIKKDTWMSVSSIHNFIDPECMQFSSYKYTVCDENDSGIIVQLRTS